MKAQGFFKFEFCFMLNTFLFPKNSIPEAISAAHLSKSLDEIFFTEIF